MRGLYWLFVWYVAIVNVTADDVRDRQFATSIAWTKALGFLIGTDERGLLASADVSTSPLRYPRADDVSHIVCVRIGRSDEIWIGTAGQGLVVLGKGWRRQLDLARGFPGNHVWCITIDPETSRAWVGTEGGLAIVEPDASSWVMRGIPDGIPGHGVSAIAISGTRCASAPNVMVWWSVRFLVMEIWSSGRP